MSAAPQRLVDGADTFRVRKAALRTVQAAGCHRPRAGSGHPHSVVLRTSPTPAQVTGRTGQNPVLFDGNGNKKAAYDAVLNALNAGTGTGTGTAILPRRRRPPAAAAPRRSR